MAIDPQTGMPATTEAAKPEGITDKPQAAAVAQSPATAPTGASSEPAQADAPTAVAAGPPPQVLAGPDAPAAPAQAAAQSEPLIGSWLAAHVHKMDLPYLVMLAVLTFLLGSFAAANTDIWQHMAAGRLLSEGKYNPFSGADPFGSALPGKGQAAPWINHSWLYGWISYMIYDGTGATLVVFKALCATALACVLLLIRPRHNRHGWAGTVCVLLGIVALSPGLLLQPVVISFLFLGVTLLILYRAGVIAQPEAEVNNGTNIPASSGTDVPARATTENGTNIPASSGTDVPARATAGQECPAHASFCPQPKLLWALPPLFMLWINLDNWFILGPLTLGLCIIGLLIEVGLGKKPHFNVKQLSKVLGVGLLACLLNPFHYRAVLLLPVELGYLLVRLGGDFWSDKIVAGGRAMQIWRETLGDNYQPTLTVFNGNYWQTSQGLNVAGIAFFVLLALVLFSFYLCKKANPAMLLVRAVPTLFFAVLALLLVRLIPFFAVVGAVAALLNLQEYLAWREQAEPLRVEEVNLWASLSRLVTGFLLAGLLFLAWPGWVNHTLANGNYASPRRVALRLVVDPSLEKTAAFMQERHDKGRLKRTFNLTPDNLAPDLASFCAWHAPELRFFVDARMQLQDKRTAKLVEIWRSMREEMEWHLTGKRSNVKIKVSWRDEFASHGIDSFAGAIERPGVPAFRVMIWSWVLRSCQFKTVYADGKTMVAEFGKAGKELIPRMDDCREQAFGKHDEPWPEPIAKVEEVSFWDLYLWGQDPPPLAVSEAKLYREYFIVGRAHIWGEITAAPWYVARSSLLGDLNIAPLPVVITTIVIMNDLAPADIGLPEGIVLAMRRAREGVAEDGQSFSAHGVYGQVINVLDQQENRWCGGQPPAGFFLQSEGLRGNLRGNLRKFQFVAAWERYLKIRPQDAQVHLFLYQHFYNERCFDLALEHLRQYAELADASDRSEEKKQIEDRKAYVKKLVDDRENKLLLHTKHDASEFDKAMAAYWGDYDISVGERIHIDQMRLLAKSHALLWDIIQSKNYNQKEAFVLETLFRIDLQMGNVSELDSILESQPKFFNEFTKVNPLSAHEYLFYYHGIKGDYEKADAELAALEKLWDEFDSNKRKTIPAHLLAPLHAFALPGSPPLPLLAYPPFYFQLQLIEDDMTRLTQAQAERKTMRGILAIEVGMNQRALRFFRDALNMAGPKAYPGFYPNRKIAERYKELLEGR